MSGLDGQVVIITGAGRGIGRAIALKLAGERADIVGVQRTAAELETLVADIRKQGGGGLAVPADVRFFSEAERVVATTVEAFGGVDILVNCAGAVIAGAGSMQTVLQTDPVALEAMLDVNFKGTAYFSRAVLPHMLAQGRGRIINIASVSGCHGQPSQAAYCASKFAVRGFAEALAQEVAARGVLVTTLFPGGTNTEVWDRLPYPHGEHTREELLPPDSVAEFVRVIATMPRTVLVKEIVLFPPHEWH
jgi:NADP-dependent 3-hydroxy acid dehydrogenase YdfG